MAVYHLIRTQRLPITLENAWDFFSSPLNLQRITPAEMGFEVRTDRQRLQKMYAGQIIEYTVRPVLGFPLYWMTEITHVEHLKFFVDEQRFGPYSLWHHQHHFKEINGGVEMTDLVHYKIPLGPLGDLAHAVFVKRKLNQIFDYRFQVLEEMFGKMPIVSST